MTLEQIAKAAAKKYLLHSNLRVKDIILEAIEKAQSAHLDLPSEDTFVGWCMDDTEITNTDAELEKMADDVYDRWLDDAVEFNEYDAVIIKSDILKALRTVRDTMDKTHAEQIRALLPAAKKLKETTNAQIVLPSKEQVEKFLQEISWSKQASDYEKTLVAGNIRYFYGWFHSQIKIAQPISEEKLRDIVMEKTEETLVHYYNWVQAATGEEFKPGYDWDSLCGCSFRSGKELGFLAAEKFHGIKK